jgi:hypothetical protein
MIFPEATSLRPREEETMPRFRLARDVWVVVVVKVILVISAAIFVFGPSQRPKVDAAGIETHLVGKIPQ